MSNKSTVNCLLKPVETLLVLDHSGLSWNNLPFSPWLIFVLIAVCGSLIYGASLTPGFRSSALWQSALLLTVSAGLAWSIFGPILVLFSGKNPFVCAHACLVTMVYGELVLIFGAFFNWSGILSHAIFGFDRAIFGWLWIGLSNIIMVIALSVQMKALDIPHWKTLSIWIIVLNGSGMTIFILLKQLMKV